MSPFSAKVRRVIDGDTLAVEVRIRTRSSAPGGQSAEGIVATAAMKKRFPIGKEIVIEPIVVDQFGRIVATIPE